MLKILAWRHKSKNLALRSRVRVQTLCPCKSHTRPPSIPPRRREQPGTTDNYKLQNCVIV